MHLHCTMTTWRNGEIKTLVCQDVEVKYCQLNQYNGTNLDCWPLKWGHAGALWCCMGYYAGIVWVLLLTFCRFFLLFVTYVVIKYITKAQTTPGITAKQYRDTLNEALIELLFTACDLTRRYLFFFLNYKSVLLCVVLKIWRLLFSKSWADEFGAQLINLSDHNDCHISIPAEQPAHTLTVGCGRHNT